MVPRDSDPRPMTRSVFSVSHVWQDAMSVLGQCAGQHVRMFHIYRVPRNCHSSRKSPGNTDGAGGGAGPISESLVAIAAALDSHYDFNPSGRLMFHGRLRGLNSATGPRGREAFS